MVDAVKETMHADGLETLLVKSVCEYEIIIEIDKLRVKNIFFIIVEICIF